MMARASLLRLPFVPPMVVASCRDYVVAAAPMMAILLFVLDCLCVPSTFRVPWHPCLVGAPSMVSMLIPTSPEPWQQLDNILVKASGR